MSLDLDVEPTYDVRQDLYAHLRWSEVVEQIDEVLGSAYSVSVFGRRIDADPTEVLVKSRATDDREPAGWIGGTEAVPAATASLTLGAGDHLTVAAPPGRGRSVCPTSGATGSPASARRSSRSGSSPPPTLRLPCAP